MPAPNYVNTWMDQNKPGEIHNLGGDCINPKCDYEFNYNDQRKLDDHGSMTCPNCATQITHDQLWGEQAGGTTRASLTLKQMGNIAEDLIQEIGSLPGIGQVIKRFSDYHWPIDFLIGEYGVEVKANHSEAQARFKLGDGKERQNKIEYCAKNKLLPGFIGVRLNFYTDHADIFFRPGFTDTWIGNSSMRHLGTYNFAHLNPYKNPADVPKLPDQSITDVDDVPFGKSDLDDLFGPDITKEGSQHFSFTPSGATYEELEQAEKPIVHEDDEGFINYAWPLNKPTYTYEGKLENHTFWPEATVMNAYSPKGDLIGSAEGTMDGPHLNFSQMYVHPDWRHTDVAFGLGTNMIKRFPGVPVKSQLEEPRLQHLVKRYNESLGYDTEVRPVHYDEDENGKSKYIYYADPKMKLAMIRSNISIQPAMSKMFDWKGNQTLNPSQYHSMGMEPMNLIDQYGDTVGSFAHGEAPFTPNHVLVPSLYIHPRYRNTDATHKVFNWLRNQYPGKTFGATFENSRIEPMVKRYNERIKQQKMPGALSKVAAQILTPEQQPKLQDQIMQLARKHGIWINWVHSDDARAGMGDVSIPPILTDYDYIVALHEFGHIIAHQEGHAQPHTLNPSLMWQWDNSHEVEQPLHSDEEAIEDEANVWNWAFKNSLIPISQAVMDQVKSDAHTYYDDAKQNPWYEDMDYPRTGPAWEQFNQMVSPQPTQMNLLSNTKVAMPWSNNVFYHLTDSSSLPSIQKHGLQPRTFSDSRPLWRNIPVDEHSVYLYPDAGRAWDYRNTLEHQKDIGRNVRPSYAGPKLLRVSDIDRANIWPDHEDFEDYIMQLRQRKDDRESGWLSEDQDLQPHEEHALQMAELHGAHDADSLKTLGNMNPEHRAKIAEDMATDQGSRLMHRGPIHPRHIEVGTPNIYDIDEMHDQFYNENPDFKIDDDMLDDPHDEDERADAHNQAVGEWSQNKNWFGDENDPMYGQHPYEEWDESDPWENHFTWQPLVKPTPAPANQMSLGDAWQ